MFFLTHTLPAVSTLVEAPFYSLLSRPIAIIEIFPILVFVRFHKYKDANTPNLRTFAAKMGKLSIIGFHLQ